MWTGASGAVGGCPNGSAPVVPGASAARRVDRPRTSPGQRRAELGLSEQELIVTRQALDDLRDRLYVLEAAIEDVEHDLEEGETDQVLRDALSWLLAAARPLVAQGHDLT